MEQDGRGRIIRGVGAVTALAGTVASVYTARLGLDALAEQPLMEMANQLNDVEKILSSVSFMASVSIASAGVMVSMK